MICGVKGCSRPVRLSRGFALRAQDRPQNPVLNLHLNRLRDLGRPLAPLLHRAQIIGARAPLAKRHRQNIRRRHRVLDREVDTHAADRAHRMRRIADAEQPLARPFAQPIDLHGQQAHLVEALDALDPVAREARRGA